MKILKLSSLVALMAIVFFACKKELSSPDVTSNAKGGVASGNQYVTPTLTCDPATTTLSSIGLIVTAGSTGAPSGFSIQWMTEEDFKQFGWPTGAITEDQTSVAPSFCKGSFSGNANASRYNLAADESVKVNIGAFLFDNGASTNCDTELQPCTKYVFRIFAHGDNVKNRSNFSSAVPCETECDNECAGQKKGYGYWKNNCDLIPSAGLTLGTVSYSKEEICTILNTRPNVVCTGSGKSRECSANGLIILAHQLITAKLNGFTTTDADAAVGSQNVLTDYQKANWKNDIMSTLKGANESCK